MHFMAKSAQVTDLALRLLHLHLHLHLHLLLLHLLLHLLLLLQLLVQLLQDLHHLYRILLLLRGL